MKRFTMRSSSEWNATTISRPPGASSLLAWSSAALDLAQLVVHPDAQCLEARVAGSMPERSGGSTPRMIAASRVVVVIGASARARDDGAGDAA